MAGNRLFAMPQEVAKRVQLSSSFDTKSIVSSQCGCISGLSFTMMEPRILHLGVEVCNVFHAVSFLMRYVYVNRLCHGFSPHTILAILSLNDA